VVVAAAVEEVEAVEAAPLAEGYQPGVEVVAVAAAPPVVVEALASAAGGGQVPA
jgi:hypothetical protein